MRHIRNMIFSFALGLAALSGGVRSDELERLLSAMHRPMVAHTLPDESPEGEPPGP